MQKFELVILGAGPAGLAAATAADEQDASFIVLERGAPSRGRDRDRSDALVTGVGGAGLYSDGKFSFAPSATALWRLEPRSALREAYEWTANLLRLHDMDAPPFPHEVEVGDVSGLKRYRSEYMPLDERLSLVGSLEALAGSRIMTGTAATLRIQDRGVAAEIPGARLSGAVAVLASGRFGPLARVDGVVSTFRRVEIGMRVEQPATRFALDVGALAEQLDPKWIRRSPDGRYEWRTFCCCRRGEVVDTCFGDLVTVSGRADGPQTNRSNFGFNVRLLDPAEAEPALAAALDAARRPPLRLRAEQLVASPAESQVADALGATVATALAEGLALLCQELGVSLDGASLHLPAIEGVGYYPAVTSSLRVNAAVWAAGDASGAFRGLIPALVSGRLAAMQAIDVVRGA